MAKESLGFIGVGRMGGPMARRLIEAGYALTIFDTNPAAMDSLAGLGASKAGSAAEAGSVAEIVLASLPTPDVVKAVALGEKGIAAGSKVKLFVDLSTTGPRMAATVAEGLAKHAITAVDAPVSGGVGGAIKGTLAVMVSGPPAAAERLRPVLQAIGNVFVVGERPGMGQVMKLVNNLLSVTALAVSSEAVVMGVKAGLNPKLMLDVINAGSGRNSATVDKLPKAVLPRTFDFGFALELSYKDMKLCLEEAEALGVPMVVGNAVRQLMAIAKATQGGGADFTTVVRCVEAWAGVEVKG